MTTQYLIDTLNPTGLPQIMDELQNGAVTRTYAYGLERISENQLIGGTWTARFYGYDGHGRVRFLTSMAGSVTDTYNYDALGNDISSTGSTPNEFLFAGEQFDPALGFYYLRARYYRPATGRFWSMDPIWGKLCCGLNWNPYIYGLDNPVNGTDPTGREAFIEYLRLITPAAPTPPPPPLLNLRPSSQNPSVEKIIKEFLPTAPPKVCEQWEHIEEVATAGELVLGGLQSAGVEIDIGGPAAQVALHKIILPVYIELLCP